MMVTERAARSIRAQDAAAERKAFFYDLYITPWGWDPKFYNLDGILAGKRISRWSFRRWEALGWIRPIERSPYYELTIRGEEVFQDAKDELEDDYDDDYDFDYYDDDDDYPPYWELDDEDD